MFGAAALLAMVALGGPAGAAQAVRTPDQRQTPRADAVNMDFRPMGDADPFGNISEKRIQGVLRRPGLCLGGPCSRKLKTQCLATVLAQLAGR